MVGTWKGDRVETREVDVDDGRDGREQRSGGVGVDLGGWRHVWEEKGK